MVSASCQLEHSILQILAQTACQNSVCSGFWKLRKIGIMRSPRFAFSRSMKILQKTWPNALSVRLRPTNIDSERVATQTSKQATVSSHTNISRHHDITLFCVRFSMEIQMQCRALSIHIRHQSCYISHAPKLRAIVMPKFGLYPILRHAQDWGQITYFSSDLRQRFATLCGVLSIHVRHQSLSIPHALPLRAISMPKLGL